MTHSNKLVGALLISVLAIGSTLPSQYIEIEPSEATGPIQQAKDAIATSLSYVSDTAQTYPKLTAAASTGTLALAYGIHAYSNGYTPTVQIKLAWKRIVKLVKFVLLLNRPDQKSLKGMFLKALYLYACTQTGKYALRQLILNKFFPVKPTFTKVGEPFRIVIITPIFEELFCTALPIAFFGKKSLIAVPIIFGLLHTSGMSENNWNIHAFFRTAFTSFVRTQTFYHHPGELLVCIMHHAITNLMVNAGIDTPYDPPRLSVRSLPSR